MFVVDQKMPVKKSLKRKKSSLRSKAKTRSKKSYSQRVYPKKRAKVSKAVDLVRACEAKYALACIDPFHPQAEGSCVPKLPARSSYKVSGKIFGTMHMGDSANALGYVVAKPCLANDLDCVAYTEAQATADEIFTDAQEPVNKLSRVACTDLPVNYNQLVAPDERHGPTARGRIISAGLRVRYIGDQESMNGVLYAYSSPGHESIENMGPDEFKKQMSCRRIPITRKWVTVTCSAVEDHELNYSSDKFPSYLQAVTQTTFTDLIDRDNIIRGVCYPFSNGARVGNTLNEDTNDLKGTPIMGIIYEGTQGKAAKFEFEYIQHTEYAYKIEHQNETMNHIGTKSELLASSISQAKNYSGKSSSDELQIENAVNNLMKDSSLRGIGQSVASAVMLTRDVAHYAQLGMSFYNELQQVYDILPY